MWYAHNVAASSTAIRIAHDATSRRPWNARSTISAISAMHSPHTGFCEVISKNRPDVAMS